MLEFLKVYLLKMSFISKLTRKIPDLFPQRSYAQNGEDLVLDRLLGYRNNGFYVDVGAHHPRRFSNTFLFYRRGWCGINIDAMPGSMRAFKRSRPKDINIESGVAREEGVLTYHQFNEPALNTFDALEARVKNNPPYRIIKKINIKVERLDSLLESHLLMGRNIDFLSVDAEGMDEDVLRSNNWEKFRPSFVLAETLRSNLLNLSECPVVSFMLSKNYIPVSKVYDTVIFSERAS